MRCRRCPIPLRVSHLLTNHLDSRNPNNTHGSMPAYVGTWDMNALTALATWPGALTPLKSIARCICVVVGVVTQPSLANPIIHTGLCRRVTAQLDVTIRCPTSWGFSTSWRVHSSLIPSS